MTYAMTAIKRHAKIWIPATVGLLLAAVLVGFAPAKGDPETGPKVWTMVPPEPWAGGETSFSGPTPENAPDAHSWSHARTPDPPGHETARPDDEHPESWDGARVDADGGLRVAVDIEADVDVAADIEES